MKGNENGRKWNENDKNRAVGNNSTTYSAREATLPLPIGSVAQRALENRNLSRTVGLCWQELLYIQLVSKVSRFLQFSFLDSRIEDFDLRFQSSTLRLERRAWKIAHRCPRVPTGARRCRALKSLVPLGAQEFWALLALLAHLCPLEPKNIGHSWHFLHTYAPWGISCTLRASMLDPTDTYGYPRVPGTQGTSASWSPRMLGTLGTVGTCCPVIPLGSQECRAFSILVALGSQSLSVSVAHWCPWELGTLGHFGHLVLEGPRACLSEPWARICPRILGTLGLVALLEQGTLGSRCLIVPLGDRHFWALGAKWTHKQPKCVPGVHPNPKRGVSSREQNSRDYLNQDSPTNLFRIVEQDSKFFSRDYPDLDSWDSWQIRSPNVTSLKVVPNLGMTLARTWSRRVL
ncbi:hypothetical protein M9H77_30120 [Catharanthus roseus]|uniref:Uncharacterized protein n=1 Tax=Catharanthus roseus TaxID=4058 RepID=A0ACB9ZWC6_CATRO|nr:hypothetical protein M9H77_30120 [Catharanthus roseus]